MLLLSLSLTKDLFSLLHALSSLHLMSFSFQPEFNSIAYTNHAILLSLNGRNSKSLFSNIFSVVVETPTLFIPSRKTIFILSTLSITPNFSLANTPSDASEPFVPRNVLYESLLKSRMTLEPQTTLIPCWIKLIVSSPIFSKTLPSTRIPSNPFLGMSTKEFQMTFTMTSRNQSLKMKSCKLSTLWPL